MLPILKTTTTAIAEMSDANQLADIYRQAEALVRLMMDDREAQAQIAKRRNHALRRIGQLREEVGNPSIAMTATEFDTSLGLSQRDVQKAVSLAAMDQLEFEARETTTGATLFSGTRYGLTLEKDNQNLIAARKAKAEKDREERAKLYSGPRPTSVMPDTLEATLTPAPTREPRPLPTIEVTDVTPVKWNPAPWFNSMQLLLDNNPFDNTPDAERQQCWDRIDAMLDQLATIQRGLQHG